MTHIENVIDAFLNHCHDRTEQHLDHGPYYQDNELNLRCPTDHEIIVPSAEWIFNQDPPAPKRRRKK